MIAQNRGEGIRGRSKGWNGIESRSEESYYGSEGVMSLYQNVLIPELKSTASGSSVPFTFQSAKHEDDVVMNVLKNVFQSFANFST